jgi:hypothetical protein
MQPVENNAEKDSLASRSVLELFGSLLSGTAKHPEICFYMSFFCQFIHKPKLDNLLHFAEISLEHYEIGLAVLSYLYHVKDIGLH